MRSLRFAPAPVARKSRSDDRPRPDTVIDRNPVAFFLWYWAHTLVGHYPRWRGHAPAEGGHRPAGWIVQWVHDK
jgi:hypothetical protein